MSEFRYVGSELDLFAAVRNWKAYWSAQVRPFVHGNVLEVGAGMGSNTPFLRSPAHAGQWVCLEPDPGLVDRLIRNQESSDPSRSHEAVCGTLAALAGRQFDTIIYIDVLEHIEHDRQELETAASHLRSGGCLIVLAPAHPRLFSPFDAAIGHFRRYNRSMLCNIAPAGLRPERLRYLDSAGFLLSAANRLFLRQSMPTKAQLKFWDDWVIPLSRILDPLCLYSVGKTVIAVWTKT